MGHQDATYFDSSNRVYSSKGYGVSSDDWNFVAISFGSSSPQLHLVHNRHPKQDAPDPLQANFRIVDETTSNEMYEFFTPALVGAILQAAPGYDVLVHSGWLYLLKSSLYEEGTHADGIARRLEIAQRLVPMVVKQR